MKQLTLSAIALVLATPLYAGGTTQPVQIYVPPVEPVLDWTGFYGGVQYDHIASGTLSSGGASSDLSGFGAVLFGGYRYDFGNWVVGGELDYGIAGDVEAAGGTGAVDFGTDRLGLEAGYDLGRTLVYGTVGAANVTVGTGSDTATFYGIGVDYMITDAITVGAEVLQHTVSDFDGVAGDDIDVLTVGLNAAYRF